MFLYAKLFSNLCEVGGNLFSIAGDQNEICVTACSTRLQYLI
jgi:hypothetical protein